MTRGPFHLALDPSEPVTVGLPISLHTRVEDEARLRKISKSKLIRDAINAYLCPPKISLADALANHK
jgi:hypothetical protein